MAERNERPIFEGNNRRVESRRGTDRRKIGLFITVLKYLAVVVFVILFVKIFSQ